jgi:ABC-2 type transport system ATP-binding protein
VMIDNQYDQHKHPLDYRRRVTLAEAEPVYPSFLTPRNLLQFVSKTRQAPDMQMEELIVRLGISSFIDQPFSTFSSGMLKKVSLAMAFIGTPSLIILDEPLITIDKETRGLLYDLIREKALKSTGFLLSSHQAFTREDLPVRGIFEVKNHTLVEIGQV